MKKYANKKRSDVEEYKVGNLVMLSTKDLKYQMVGEKNRKVDRKVCRPVVKDGIPEKQKYGMIDRNYTPFWSNVQRRRGMYLAIIERRLRQ